MKEWKNDLGKEKYDDETNEEKRAIENGEVESPEQAKDGEANHTGETNNNETAPASSVTEEKTQTGQKKPGSGGKVNEPTF